jgi:hypothetical protein
MKSNGAILICEMFNISIDSCLLLYISRGFDYRHLYVTRLARSSSRVSRFAMRMLFRVTGSKSVRNREEFRID